MGTEFKLDLNGTDPDGDRLDYKFKAADLEGVKDRAMVTVSPSGAGVFRWTPLASDVGQHAFDFTASDGSNDTTVTITIDVKSAIGAATAPIFRQPLGSGTTIELAKAQCADLSVVVEDQDTAQVTLRQEEPLIDGAKLTQEDGQSAKWHWCPSHGQGDDRYTLVLSADDGENPKTIKNYLIVLRSGSGNTNCPGGAPAITHTASNQTTRLDLKPTATITDDKGLKDAPLFYYSFTNPGTQQVNLSTMTQLTTTKVSGTNTNGTWAPTLPNPVANAAAGTTKTIYYVFVADDDDDTMGSCDHTTTSQIYTMTVTAGGTSTAGTCAACTADSQCGAGGECVYMGSMGDAYCLQGCGSGCPTGYTCSASPIYSVDGAQNNQCVPQSGSCQMPTGACADDTWEENDSRSEASANPTLAAGLDDYVACPSATSPTTRTDDDWYKVVLTADSRVNFEISGDGASDLDLHLYNSDGTVVSASTSYTSDENITTCLKAATYYVKVNGYGGARSEYLMQYDKTAESCDTTCVDDTHEDDDTYSQARTTAYPTDSSTANKICKNDDDWYKVRLYENEKLTTDLTFTQTTSAQDLDIHLYKDFTDLWPCSPTDASTCTSAHGQGAVSNEHAVYTVPAGTCSSGCDYYVVVRGWNGATNTYGINLKVE